MGLCAPAPAPLRAACDDPALEVDELPLVCAAPVDSAAGAGRCCSATWPLLCGSGPVMACADWERLEEVGETDDEGARRPRTRQSSCLVGADERLGTVTGSRQAQQPVTSKRTTTKACSRPTGGAPPRSRLTGINTLWRKRLARRCTGTDQNQCSMRPPRLAQRAVSQALLPFLLPSSLSSSPRLACPRAEPRPPSASQRRSAAPTSQGEDEVKRRASLDLEVLCLLVVGPVSESFGSVSAGSLRVRPGGSAVALTQNGQEHGDRTHMALPRKIRRCCAGGMPSFSSSCSLIFWVCERA